jgi:hypothetical protein
MSKPKFPSYFTLLDRRIATARSLSEDLKKALPSRFQYTIEREGEKAFVKITDQSHSLEWTVPHWYNVKFTVTHIINSFLK